MLAVEKKTAYGCLVIGDLPSDGTPFKKKPFWMPEDALTARPHTHSLYEGLSEDYYAARKGHAGANIVALGSGGWAALALSVQLPVPRAVLMATPKEWEWPAVDGYLQSQARQIMRFARRNLAFCLAEILFVSAGGKAAEIHAALQKSLPNAHSNRLILKGDYEKALCTNCENPFNRLIRRFLRGEELPKTLAESGEMCIIL